MPLSRGRNPRPGREDRWASRDGSPGSALLPGHGGEDAAERESEQRLPKAGGVRKPGWAGIRAKGWERPAPRPPGRTLVKPALNPWWVRVPGSLSGEVRCRDKIGPHPPVPAACIPSAHVHRPGEDPGTVCWKDREENETPTYDPST